MPRGRKKKQPGISPKPEETPANKTPAAAPETSKVKTEDIVANATTKKTGPKAGQNIEHEKDGNEAAKAFAVRERTQIETDRALGACAVATEADCVTVKTSVKSEICDFCGEPSVGRIFVYSDGLELRRGYEKDACKKHRTLDGGPMP